MTKKNIYKAAVIGCGYIGTGVEYFNRSIQPATHAGAYSANKHTELVALVDTNKRQLEIAHKYFPNARLYTNIAQMCIAEKPDIVSVASSTGSHYKVVMEVAKYHPPVILCEKPISDTITRAQEMISVCKENGSQLFINYQRHFDPLIQKWARKIQKGALGKLYQGNVYYYNGLLNNAGHMIDILNMFLGLPSEVSARFNLITETKGKGANIDGVLRYRNGAIITLQTLSQNYGHFALGLFGEKGMVSITKSTSPQIEYRKKVPNREAKRYFQLSVKVIREGEARSTLAPVIHHIVSYLDGKVQPISVGSDGLSVLNVLNALLKSAKAGGKSIHL